MRYRSRLRRSIKAACSLSADRAVEVSLKLIEALDKDSEPGNEGVDVLSASMKECFGLVALQQV
jgi:hypothetical protein